MPRRPIPRTVRFSPGAVYYKPQGIPLRALDEVVLGLDEVEALRLADREGFSHEDVGRHMNVSRATAGRILGGARAKVADALVTGKALRLEGGPARMVPSPPVPGGPQMPFGGPGHGRGRRRGRGRGRGGPPWAANGT